MISYPRLIPGIFFAVLHYLLPPSRIKGKKTMHTYSKHYFHIVFGVKYRQPLLSKPWQDDLFAVMAGIVKTKGQIPLIVNGYRDHVHLLVRMLPSMSVADLVRVVKNNTTNFVNHNGFTRKRFSWQSGYGSFTCAGSSVDNVYRYIQNQESHHREKDFEKEYKGFLRQSGIEYDPVHLFD